MCGRLCVVVLVSMESLVGVGDGGRWMMGSRCQVCGDVVGVGVASAKRRKLASLVRGVCVSKGSVYLCGESVGALTMVESMGVLVVRLLLRLSRFVWLRVVFEDDCVGRGVWLL